MDDLALLAMIPLHPIVPFEQYDYECKFSYTPTSTIPTKNLGQNRFSHALLADAYALFAFKSFTLPLLRFESKQIQSHTPCGCYAHLALAHRREIIETYSIFNVKP
jgi:hypothetical protein